MERVEFFKDKGILLFNLFMQTISLYLHFSFINETYVFMIPTFMFGFLGILECWFMIEKKKFVNSQKSEVKS